MNKIKDEISKEIWDVVKDNYERGSYTTAITNLIQYVNEIIREKSELTHDGTALMEKAFLGNNPALKINKFETQTEKDIQAGIGYILKGMCLAIRNPRAHERHNDTIDTANRIIVFVDYILDFFKDKKYGNLIDDWMDIIYDENFSEDEEYAQELFNVLPAKKRYDLLINIFRNKSHIKSINTTIFIKKLSQGISSDELDDFIDSISKELTTIKLSEDLFNFFRILPADLWEKINKIPRLRIESMVETSIKKGWVEYAYNEHEDTFHSYLNNDGKLAVFAKKHISYFSNKTKILDEIIKCLTSNDSHRRAYFDDCLIEIVDLNDDSFNMDILSCMVNGYINKDEENKKFVNFIKKKVKIEKKQIWIDAFEKLYDKEILKRNTLKPIADEELPF